MILGMEQVVCFFTAGSTEELFVESLDIRVFVRAADDFAFVFGIETFHALFKQFGIAVQEGLTAAVDTAAGTSHDFDSLEAVFVSADHIENFACITETGADSNVDGFTGSDFDFGFFDTVETADCAEIDSVAFEVFAVEHVVNGTACSFENTAGNTENVSGTC